MLAVERRPSSVDPRRWQAELEEAASRFTARATAEVQPCDRLWLALECAACEGRDTRVIACLESPWMGGASAPLHRWARDFDGLLEQVLRGARPEAIDEVTWSAARRCACGAPVHRTHVVGAALFVALLGQGASLVASRFDAEPIRLARMADGSGLLASIEASERVERSVSLFESWLELAARLPVDAHMVGTQADPGVWMFAAAEARVLHAGIERKLASTPRVVVRLDVETARAFGWPAELGALASHLERGAVAALVVERSAMVAQLRAAARTRLHADVRDEGGPTVQLATSRGAWPIALADLALSMARHGRPLARACAHALREAERTLSERLEVLEALTAFVPGAFFAVEGASATAHRPDGCEGRTVQLVQLPANWSALPEVELAREAAFLFDLAPPWADRTCVCPCGAAAELEARMVAWPWTGTEETRPWVLGFVGDPAQPMAAHVVAVCCDRHVRVVGEAELRRLGLDEAALARRLATDGLRVRPRVLASLACGDDGLAVAVAQAPFVSGVVLDDARMSALDEALGRPIGPGPAIAFAVGTEAVVWTAAVGAAVERVDAVVRGMSLASNGVVLRRDLELTDDGSASFDVIWSGNERSR